MLSIAKLRVGHEAYHLSGVAESFDDYYTGAGEADGQWLGGSAARLGLTGTVQSEDLQAVLAGMAPGTGGLSPNGTTPTTHPRRVPGFDLTFKAPKSASVLYAVSDDPAVQGAVIEAGDQAMQAAIGWLEREAIEVQRGSHNQAWLAGHTDMPGAGRRRLGTSGVVAASFRHRTSRASDPLLHWHVLVANLVEGADGKWSAFAHPDLYRNARAAGEVFQGVYRQELTDRLGVEWRPGRHVPEIAGIPQGLLDRFSKRSAEIDAWLAATGTPNDAAGRQEAVLATRRHKPEMEGERFDAEWKREAIEYGWGPEHADRLIAEADELATPGYQQAWRIDDTAFDEHGVPEPYERSVHPEDWIADVLRRDLTNSDSTFTLADLTQAIAARQGHGATVGTIERIAHRVLASDHTVPVTTRPGQPRSWTSRELLDTETQFIAAMHQSAVSIAPSDDVVDAAIAVKVGLGVDQAAAVRSLSRSAHAVSVMIGPAGTGKTFTVDAIRVAFEQAGYRVLGAAPSARAALELADGAHIESRTIHSILQRWATGLDTPARQSLLVIDEAGMADIRTLTTIVEQQVAAGGRVLLVGDHHQLPEIGAGGGFAYAAEHAYTVCELTINRRQQQPWEQAALHELRDGSVPQAVHAYLEHGRVIVAETPADMIRTAVDAWFASRDGGLTPVLLAGTNQIVDVLNDTVIGRLIAQGELDDIDPTGYGPGAYRIGERVVVRRNSNQQTTTGGDVALANGQPGTIISTRHGQLTVRLDHTGDEVILDASYLQRGGHVTHAYALTTHRAQGGTWDQAIAVGADGLYREGAYVEMSRGADHNLIVLTDPEIAELHRQLQAEAETERHDTGLDIDDHPSVDDELARRMSNNHAKELAHSVDSHIETIDRLSRTRTLPALEQHLTLAESAEREAADVIGASREQLHATITRLDHTARHLDIGIHVSPHDRNNIGTVTDIDDNTGTATVHFTSRDGLRHADRTYPWADLRIVEPHTAPTRSLTPAAEHTLDQLIRHIEQQLEQCDQLIREHGVEPDDRVIYSRALEQHIVRHTNTSIAAQPEWLDQLIGPEPGDATGAQVWNDTVAQICTWRLRHHINPDADGLGPRPTGQDEAAEWDVISCRIGLARAWLNTTDRAQPLWPTIPSYRELQQREEQLHQIFAGAPADCAEIIDQLRNGQLTLDVTTEILQSALTQQTERRAWIVGHWPHVIEFQEIHRTLDNGTWGPDPELLDLAPNIAASPALTDAIANNETWLRPALCAIANRHDTQLDDDALGWLEAVATHRRRYDVTGSDPLDRSTPESALQRDERNGLIEDLATFEIQRPDVRDLGLDTIDF